ncbi:MAG: lactate racemase domain-containing protein, partial [Candidatus Binataceae bacterium]
MARPEAKLKELKPAELKHDVGARRDLVVTVNRRSERRLIAYGEEFLYEKLPVGTRVIYPPPPLEELPDPDQAIRYALLRPENADPLFAQLNPNMRVTIAIDDISLPLPQMRAPDIRERVLNQMLQTLADYGVDDVHIIIATALHRRMTEAEIRRVVGERAFKQFWPDRLYNFDAENRSEITMLGKTDHGEEVWLSKRAVESDLLLYVNINLVPMDGGHKSVAVGLAPYQSLRHHHNPATLRDSHSYMDPKHSGLHRSANRMGAIVKEHLNVFTVETAVNTHMYGGMMDFLHKNEDQFSDWDRTRTNAFRWTMRNMSNELRRNVLHNYRSPYGMTGVWAGDTDAVHEKALARVFQQYAVPVKGQADILIVGVPFICPYNVNSIMNPILVQCTGMGYL